VELYEEGGWDVNVILGIDLDNDGIFEADLPAWHGIGEPYWNVTNLHGDTFAEMDGAYGPLGGNVEDWVYAYDTSRWWTPNATGNGLSKDLYCTLGQLIERVDEGEWDTNIPNSNVRVLLIKLLLGGSGSWNDERAYVEAVYLQTAGEYTEYWFDFEPVPYIELSPNQGISTYLVSGHYFTPDAEVILRWDGEVMPVLPPVVEVQNDGNFYALGVVQTQGEAGVHIVNATDEGERTAIVKFIVPDLTGPQGPKGDTGATGPMGPQGLQGIQGVQGSKGDKGDKGDTGEQGLQGVQGVQGEQGEKGDTGLVGPEGPQGETGSQGPTGPKGDVGARGPAGVAGTPADMTLVYLALVLAAIAIVIAIVSLRRKK